MVGINKQIEKNVERKINLGSGITVCSEKEKKIPNLDSWEDPSCGESSENDFQ